jgi:predicted KAP-like P-loop ATPase
MALAFVPDKDDKSSGGNNENSSASNKISIITDEPITDAPDFDKYSEALSNIIANSKPRFTVGIYGGWGTGKTTIMQMIQKHLDEEYKNDIITIWFDSWRYEYEEFSALVPLVRTIILHLEEYVLKLEFEKNPKTVVIKNLVNKFKKVGESIIINSKANLGLEYFGAKASVETDLGKTIEHYKSEGSFHKNQSRIYFHKHISDFVSDELKDIRGDKQETKNLKIVIFVDDLDRCTPERALEILESIKTFFDIVGIIFVIGIDPSTIDSIIKTKYGEDSKIDGMRYLQKIVQLPYTVPLWNPPRLSDSITSMIKKTHLPKNVIEKVLDSKMQELIIKATELNPRDIKRFINSIVISQEIYGQKINDIEKIIVIQAFYFHGDKWIEFTYGIQTLKNNIEGLKRISSCQMLNAELKN